MHCPGRVCVARVRAATRNMVWCPGRLLCACRRNHRSTSKETTRALQKAPFVAPRHVLALDKMQRPAASLRALVDASNNLPPPKTCPTCKAKVNQQGIPFPTDAAIEAHQQTKACAAPQKVQRQSATHVNCSDCKYFHSTPQAITQHQRWCGGVTQFGCTQCKAHNIPGAYKQSKAELQAHKADAHDVAVAA